MRRYRRRIISAAAIAGAVALGQYAVHAAVRIGPVVSATVQRSRVNLQDRLRQRPPEQAASQARAVLAGSSVDGVWSAPDAARLAPQVASRLAPGVPGAIVTLNGDALQAILSRAPLEDTTPIGAPSTEITLPLPDGGFSRFSIEESPILARELAAAFPEIKTYRGIGIDDPTASARFGWTDLGFHAIVLASGGSLYVDPYTPGDRENYVSVRKADLPGGGDFKCELGSGPFVAPRDEAALPIGSGAIKRTYRLALGATAEYTAAAGGTKPAALSRMVTTINRVNGIYTRDLAVSLTLSTGTGADPTALIFTNGATDGYSNDIPDALLDENQSKLDTVIGSANYDIGHVFSTGGGGLAALGVVCSAGFKAQGETGSDNPTGDAFDVDYVAHEIGHQFGANHTFNGTTNACGGGNRSGAHALEPGSGTTIMAYAGICDVEDLQRNSNDYFHIESLNEIGSFLAAGGSICGTTSATGNLVPTISAGANYSIPKQTPFALTASASDGNADSLTYVWEQYDLGGSTSSPATIATDDGLRPLFRSYSPVSSPIRMFPSLPFILNRANVPPQTFSGASTVSGVVCSSGTCATGEALPTTTRTLKFQATVRDNRAGGGGVASSPMSVTVVGTSGPFRVTSPNTAVSLPGGSSQTVTWDVNGSNAQSANVKISVSTDGGVTFPAVLLGSTPNDGTEGVTLPNQSTTTARIKIEAVGNVFFDISDTNFSISAGAAPGAFSKTTPANGGTGQSPTPMLSWVAAPNAAAYEYCIDTTNDNGCTTWISTGGNTSVAVSGLSASTSYYWQVRATNGVGTTYANGGSTAFWSFGTRSEFMTNGDFSSGTSGWQLYATPSLSYIQSNVTAAGVFQYYRVAPPAGTTNEAVIFQNTGVGVAADSPLDATFSLGNSNTVRKRITVLMLDSNFGDLSVCTFWLPANAPLAPYHMTTHTTKTWTNASIYFYAASAGTTGGFYQVDNVSLQPGPARPPQTTCVDPTAPMPPGGVAGPNLLTNGDFSSGVLTPWFTFGTITSQIVGGVLEFIRPTTTPPAGVLAQPTSQAVLANQILTASFQLGNSSGVRKRVTVLLHDNDFSDLAACTLWLAPGQPLASYTMKSFATRAWTNATLSVYPATVGAAQWIRLDNVTLQRTPAVTIAGTECVEPVLPRPEPTDGVMEGAAPELSRAPAGLVSPVKLGNPQKAGGATVDSRVARKRLLQ